METNIMKKLILLCLFEIVTVCAMAQQSDSEPSIASRVDHWFEMGRQNALIQQGLTDPLGKETQSETSLQHPWQIAVIWMLGNQENMLQDIEKSIKQGRTQWAVVADLRPKYDGALPKQFSQMYLTFFYKSGEKVLSKDVYLENLTEAKEYLDAIFKNFQLSSSQLHTGVVFSGHGSGIEMGNGDIWLHPSNIAFVASKYNLKIDIMFLDACYMASLDTIYYLTDWGVDYMVAAPSIIYGIPGNHPVPLILCLNEDVKESASCSVRKATKAFKKSLEEGAEYKTFSFGLIDLSALSYQTLKTYLEYYNQISKADAQFKNTVPEGSRPLNVIIHNQYEYIVNHSDRIPVSNSVKENFGHNIAQLQGQLANAYQGLEYFCYSKKTDQYYTQNERVPRKSKCKVGISSSRDQYENLLVHENF